MHTQHVRTHMHTHTHTHTHTHMHECMKTPKMTETKWLFHVFFGEWCQQNSVSVWLPVLFPNTLPSRIHIYLCFVLFLDAVYSPDMPKRLPIRDIVSGLVTSMARAVRYWFHYTLVAFAWLGVVPLTACKSVCVCVCVCLYSPPPPPPTWSLYTADLHLAGGGTSHCM